MEDFKPQSVKGPDGGEPITPQIITPNEGLAPESVHQPSKFGQFLRNNKWYIIAVAVGALIIAVLAAVAFWPRKEQPTQAAKVQLNIEAPQTTQAGGEVIYRIGILNQDSAKLVDMNLELIYDDGMSYVSSSPKADNLSGTNFKVPDLATGQNAVVIVKTLAQGNVNDNKRLVARLRYKFDNFNSTFTAESSHTTRLVAANVLLDFTGKTKVNSGEVVTYELTYRNTSNRPIENGRVQINYPSSFSFGASRPEPSLSNNIWNLGTLQPNQSGKIAIEGTIRASQVGQNQNLVAEFLVPDETGNYFTQSSTTYVLEIASQPISVEARVTGGTATGGIVRPGSQVGMEFTFQNNSQVVHTGLQLLVELDSSSIATGSIQTEGGFAQDGVVTWNASSTPLLEQLNVGAKGTVRVQFAIKNPATTSENKNLTVKIRPKIKSNQNSQYMSGGEVVLKIASPLAINSAVSHVGGAFPPKVGQESSFRIKLGLRNNTNDYRNGLITATIPIGVSFDSGSITASERSLTKYDNSTGRITWDFGQLLAHSGVLRSERSLEFVVKVTPTSSQVGQPISLLRNITLVATDDFTLEEITLDQQDLTTFNVSGGSSSGAVVP